MTNMRWYSEKPMAVPHIAAPACFRHVAPLVCDHGHEVVGQAMSFTTGINGRPRGLEGGGTG